MNEKNIIEKLIKNMPRSDIQLNKPFESDAEILEFAGKKLLYSMDEFSDEDLFMMNDPFVLGHNIAVAAISDIYASGGIPMFYAHSLTINETFTEKYLEKFYEGIAAVLRKANTAFIGGDFGKAESWRCCASVIGTSERPILRSTAKPGDVIYITGEIGAGNIQAAAKLYHTNVAKIKFKLRNQEAEMIRKVASSCIDTSDGVNNAINTIANMSGVGFAIEHLPYLRVGAILAKILGLPKEMLFFCECGEYELLFTAPPEITLPFHRLGKITACEKTLQGKDISKFNISAREFENPKDYLKAVKFLCDELL